MSATTGIEWADSTFNPWIGCTKVSPACDHCYAENYAKRTGQSSLWAGERRRTMASNWRAPVRWNAKRFMQCGECGWRGECDAELIGCGRCGSSVSMNDARRRVFCASLADVFDNEVPREWRYDLLWLISNTPNLDWLLLTKRVGNAARMLNDECARMGFPWPQKWPNVWLGATICNQEEADRDIPKLLATPAAKRFLSVEPLLGHICLNKIRHPETGMHMSALHRQYDGNFYDSVAQVGWVICGGESGPNARPMHPHWVRDLRDQCADAGVPFLFKQWGEWARGGDLPEHIASSTSCNFDGELTADDERVWKVGKKAAGRMLDGRTWDEVPA